MMEKHKHEIRTYSDAVNVQVRSAEEGRSEIIEGYAVVFGTRSNLIYDWMAGEKIYETIERGSVTQADLDQWDVRATLDHDFNQLLARSVNGKGSLTLTVDDHGVKYSFDVPDTIDGKRAAERIKRGELFGSSFMFSFDEKTDCTYSRDKDGILCRSVNKIVQMYDISIVQNPAYQASSVSRRSMEDAGVIEPENNNVIAEVAAMRRNIEQIY
ncbi:HK97 family phage prohead protease [Parabacteroides goldsteinii]|jgi:HK97 family phage prohead protease|uniref:HK97 family phage prohead protease n=1 Tax=Parabacteroides goldsteinii TaxID=328812 RepID=UPI00267332E9|nr:HK97 family phage prohead protease [Parabacteroides goldsteinii]